MESSTADTIQHIDNVGPVKRTMFLGISGKVSKSKKNIFGEKKIYVLCILR